MHVENSCHSELQKKKVLSTFGGEGGSQKDTEILIILCTYKYRMSKFLQNINIMSVNITR